MMRLRSNNRKLPPLPGPQQLPVIDHRHWAILFTAARARKRWTYLTLATYAGISANSCIRACTTGHCSSLTALKLCVVLDLALPQLPHVLTGHEAHHGRPATHAAA